MIPVVNWSEKSHRNCYDDGPLMEFPLPVTLLIGSLFSWTPSLVCLSSAEIIRLLCASRWSCCRRPCRISLVRCRTVFETEVSYGGVLLATASKLSEQKHSFVLHWKQARKWTRRRLPKAFIEEVQDRHKQVTSPVRAIHTVESRQYVEFCLCFTEPG